MNVTATKINANQAASFSVVATDRVGHRITINASIDCPLPPQEACTLSVTSIEGTANEVPNFPITGQGTSTLSVKSLNGMKSVTLLSATNANVVIGPVTVEPDPPPYLANPTPVTINATAINPNLPASFRVRVTGSFQHSVIINASVECPLPPQELCPLSGTVTGATGAITATFGPSGISISINSGNPNGFASVVASNIVNANVVISPFTVGQTTPVSVSATKINPNQLASFTLTASDTFGHTIVANVSVDCPIPPSEITGCTYSQGYWKNHANNWPVQNLTLGTVSYTKAQLLTILRTPVRGNGLVSLSHQLIAAKLNAATGATVPTNVANAIAAADALIGGLVVPSIGSGSLPTSATSALNSTLDQYNNGNAPGGPDHCD